MSREQMLKKRREGSKSSRRGDALFGLKDKLLGGGPYDLVGSLQPYAVVPSNGEYIETNECLQNNGGCWVDKRTNITACRDTFRGRVCRCPIVQGVKFLGDGYTHCEGALRCVINNGGCWKHTQMGRTYSACRNDHLKGCKCPPGFSGDGFKNCTDVNECEEKTVCQCRGCKCKNTWGSYECSCNGSLLYIREHDICISKDARGDVSWGVIWIIIMGLGAAALGAYTVYKYRIRTYMDSEIRAIMAQYMPLDNHPNTQPSQLEW
ncbi:unnamed protein product [Brassica oleracea]